MSRYLPTARPLVRCLRVAGASGAAADATAFRSALRSATFATTARQGRPEPTQPTATTAAAAAAAAPPPSPAAADSNAWELDPARATQPWAEKELMRRGTPPVGSRRRRAALQLLTAEAVERAIRGEGEVTGEVAGTGEGEVLGEAAGEGPIPFELMPYQCFQEARKVLLADRQEKLKEIAAETVKIRRLQEVLAGVAAGTMPMTSRGGVGFVQRRLASLRQHVEELKVQADINDPQVKRRFEDGLGDMNKPIYRHLAEQRWRDRPLRIVRQRIDQFQLAPDLLPPATLRDERLRADVELFFRSYRVPSGAVVDSLISEVCPRLRVQVFDRGTRLVTIAVVDADVPDPDNDAYFHRCHFLAANIPVAPTEPSVPLSRADPTSQLVLPWLPAYAQKGSPAHRLAVFVMEQPRQSETEMTAEATTPESVRLDTEALRASVARDGFNLRSFVKSHQLSPVGCTLFRTKWDAGTATVMERLGVPGADVELRPVHLPSLKPPRKRRGWEAKHEGPKFRHLWKYTHRIATPKRKFVR